MEEGEVGNSLPPFLYMKKLIRDDGAIYKYSVALAKNPRMKVLEEPKGENVAVEASAPEESTVEAKPKRTYTKKSTKGE